MEVLDSFQVDQSGLEERSRSDFRFVFVLIVSADSLKKASFGSKEKNRNEYYDVIRFFF